MEFMIKIVTFIRSIIKYYIVQIKKNKEQKEVKVRRMYNERIKYYVPIEYICLYKPVMENLNINKKKCTT